MARSLSDRRLRGVLAALFVLSALSAAAAAWLSVGALENRMTRDRAAAQAAAIALGAARAAEAGAPLRDQAGSAAALRAFLA
ncbi:MAG: hypothetical protein AAGF90_23535, partial [Pseudomonadota bacterium]